MTTRVVYHLPREVAHEIDEVPEAALRLLAERQPPGELVAVTEDGKIWAAPDGGDLEVARHTEIVRHMTEDREAPDKRGRCALKRDASELDLRAVSASISEPAPIVGGVSFVYRAPVAVSRAVYRHTPRPVKTAAAVGATTIGVAPVAVGTAHLWYSGAVILLANEHTQAGIQWLVSLLGG